MDLFFTLTIKQNLNQNKISGILGFKVIFFIEILFSYFIDPIITVLPLSAARPYIELIYFVEYILYLIYTSFCLLEHFAF